MIIRALYDNKPCFVNTDYIVDVFQEDFNSYIAYTLDNEREGYVIGKEDFEKWLKFQNDDIQTVRIVKDYTNYQGSVHVDDMGRYDPYTDSFVRGDK